MGIVFDIKRGGVKDGPGIRTSVFLKGCPLRCAWCHNPEGQSFAVEPMRRKDGSVVSCGTDWTPEALAVELLKNADIMKSSGGGVTFSGGEPLAQPAFVLEVARLLGAEGVTCAIETSGLADGETYDRVIARMAFVYQDLKHHDAAAFRKWCGGDLAVVMRNVASLKRSGVRHAFRVPCIPGVNDSAADRQAFRAIAGNSPIEFLPYNPAAGAKYPMLGRTYPL